MTLAVDIAIGSSAQIALLSAPALVLYAVLDRPADEAGVHRGRNHRHRPVGHRPARSACDGESNWVEGVQLLAVYLILAFAFYFVP